MAIELALDALSIASSPSSAASLPPAPDSVPAAPVKAADPPPQQISMRCLIVTQDASIIIGKGGAHVNEIRVSRGNLDHSAAWRLTRVQEKSSARVTISESIPGNPERILTVSGALDAVAKVSLLVPTSC